MERRMKPGDIEVAGGKIMSIAQWRPPPGHSIQRIMLNGCVWHRHLVEREYRCKIVGDKLWPLKEGEKVNAKVVRTVRCTECVGLELVSTKEHWWLDEEIERPKLQQGDWDFSSLKDSLYEWQFPWAWQYECWREWQPWSDFDRWRAEWRKEVKRLRAMESDGICGKRTKTEAESRAAFSYGGRLPLWLLRDFAGYFPQTPWVKIPHEKRNTLKDLPPPGNVVVHLDGSLLALKQPDPDAPSSPPIPEKLRVQRNGGGYSLRQPDPSKPEEMTLYAEYRQKTAEAFRHQMEWSDTGKPGRYREEVVLEIAPGQFVGTYIIEIPWYYPDDVINAGFAAWLKKKEGELPGVRRKFKHSGREKRYADLKQLGALRLLRSGMSAEEARAYTEKLSGRSLYERPGEWSEAKYKADENLAMFHLGSV